jgi:transketolase
MQYMADLEIKAKQLRKNMLLAASRAGRGHLGGAFSCLEILMTLYYNKLVPPNNFILSKGHSAIGLYAILEDLGVAPHALSRFCEDNSPFAEHPSIFIPGIVATTGSLGHGLGIACGLALADKLDSKTRRTFVLLGDGECEEGSVWEAARFAGDQELGNLHVIVDCNGLKSTDKTKCEPSLWRDFGFNVIEIPDGNNSDSLSRAFANEEKRIPSVALATTTKGKGISFMEKNQAWHHGVPKGELLEQALRELS